jgi:hypothetical protein
MTIQATIAAHLQAKAGGKSSQDSEEANLDSFGQTDTSKFSVASKSKVWGVEYVTVCMFSKLLTLCM